MAATVSPSITSPIIKSLVAVYGKDHVVFDGKKQIKVLGPSPRPERIQKLRQIAKMFTGATYHPSKDGSPGDVKIQGLSVIMKPAQVGSAGGEKISLKPSDIKPAIVNEWMTANEMVKNVIHYVNNTKFEDSFRDDVLTLLKNTENTPSLLVPYSGKSHIPPEFFEVLTAIKLTEMLKKNDQTIRKILGIPKDRDLRSAKIKIMIPKQANMPLTDYHINISANDRKEGEPAIKISVKSKLAGKVTNTVKFTDAFDDTAKVGEWFSSLSPKDKPQQKGQKVTAESALEASEKNKGLIYPLLAVSRLIDTSELQSVIRSRYLPKEAKGSVVFLKQVLKKVSTHFNTATVQSQLKDKSFTLSDLEIHLILKFMELALRSTQKIDPTIGNLSVSCEKILVDAATKGSEAKYNFYQMFYDTVLSEKEIAYAVAEKQGSYVKYSYYSKVNFEKEYASWVALRSKNSVNNYNKGTLGMAV